MMEKRRLKSKPFLRWMGASKMPLKVQGGGREKVKKELNCE